MGGLRSGQLKDKKKGRRIGGSGMYGIQGVPQSLCGRADARDDVAAVKLAACCFFQLYFGFCTAAPTARHLLQSFSQGYLTAGTKEWPAAPTSKSSASPTPRRTLNATAGRARAWRAGGARRCRASRTRRTGIRTRQCPRRHAIVATHASQVLDQPVRRGRAKPQVRPRAGR